ncbi:hypothetical protein Tco_0888884, partial [Tanacetum coccineum]
MEVEPLDHMKLEDLGLNTNTHDLFLSSKGFPSVDEPEPQLLPNFSPVDVIFDEVFSTWMAFGGNTCDLGSFGEETDKTMTLHQILKEVVHTECGDVVAFFKRRRIPLQTRFAGTGYSGRPKETIVQHHTSLNPSLYILKILCHEIEKIISLASEVPDIVLVITPSYEIGFRRFNSPRDHSFRKPAFVCIAVDMSRETRVIKKARIMELKRRHLKITILTSNTPYLSRKIRRICACTSLKTTKEQDLIRRNRLTKKEITMVESNEYIPVTRKNFLADDNKGRMVEKSFLEIQGMFLVKIRDNTFNGIIGENAFKPIDNFLNVVGPLKIKGPSQDRLRLSVFPISLAGVAKMETDEDDDPDDIAEFFKIEDNLFDYETPLWELQKPWDYGSNNVGNIQDNMKEYHNPSICKIRRFKMMKYSFDDDDEYVAIKEYEHSKTDIDACQAYRELFCIMDEG